MVDRLPSDADFMHSVSAIMAEMLLSRVEALLSTQGENHERPENTAHPLESQSVCLSPPIHAGPGAPES